MADSIRNGGGSRVSPGPVLLRPVHRARPWIVGAIYLAMLFPATWAPKLSGNVFSRYMTIEGIVERGSLAVETSPLRIRSGSPDLVRFGDHLYSDKPPVLPALAAVAYAPLYGAGVRFGGRPEEFFLANFVLTWGIVGVSSALVVVGLRQMLQATPIRPAVADLLTLGFGVASPLLTYAVTFNNHSVAAALITGATALVLLEDPKGPRLALRRGCAGLFAGLAATIDLPAGGVMLAALAIWLGARAKAAPWAYLAGAVPPLVLHAALQSMVTGSPLPAEMYPEAFNYPGSYWTTPEGQWRERVPRWQFGLELLFGPQGWLTVMPALVFAPIGVGLVLFKKGDPLRPLALAVSASVAILVVYYTWVVRRADFTGQSFGVRHLLPITPLCYFFCVEALGRLRSRIAWAALAGLMAIGLVYAEAGMRDPWSRVEARAPKEPALGAVQRLVLYPWSSYAR